MQKFESFKGGAYTCCVDTRLPGTFVQCVWATPSTGILLYNAQNAIKSTWDCHRCDFQSLAHAKMMPTEHFPFQKWRGMSENDSGVQVTLYECRYWMRQTGCWTWDLSPRSRKFFWISGPIVRQSWPGKVGIYVLCNLRICTIWRLRCAFHSNLEIAQLAHAHYSWYRRQLTAQQRDERQDNDDRRWFAHQ